MDKNMVCNLNTSAQCKITFTIRKESSNTYMTNLMIVCGHSNYHIHCDNGRFLYLLSNAFYHMRNHIFNIWPCNATPIGKAYIELKRRMSSYLTGDEPQCYC